MSALFAIDPAQPGALNTLLRAAVATFGRPTIGSHAPVEKTFPALFIGPDDDVIIMRACDGRNVYVKHGGKSRIFCARQYNADLDAIATYAETAPGLRAHMRQYERKQPPGLRWQRALCKRRRTLITEDTPDRLSDDPNTPAPPVMAVMAACPF